MGIRGTQDIPIDEIYDQGDNILKKAQGVLKFLESNKDGHYVKGHGKCSDDDLQNIYNAFAMTRGGFAIVDTSLPQLKDQDLLKELVGAFSFCEGDYEEMKERNIFSSTEEDKREEILKIIASNKKDCPDGPVIELRGGSVSRGKVRYCLNKRKHDWIKKFLQDKIKPILNRK